MGANNETRALQFRYTIAARAKVNAYRPKVLEENFMDVRYSQFGGCFDSYNNLLQSPNAKIAWEADWIIVNKNQSMIARSIETLRNFPTSLYASVMI